MVQVRGWTLWCAAWFERSIEQLLEDLQHTPKTSGLRLEQDPTDNSHSSTDNNAQEGERTMRKRLRAEAAEARRRRQEEAKATADKMEIEPHEEIAQSPAPTGIDIVDTSTGQCADDGLGSLTAWMELQESVLVTFVRDHSESADACEKEEQIDDNEDNKEDDEAGEHDTEELAGTFRLRLSTRDTYDDVAQIVASRLDVDEPLTLRFSACLGAPPCAHASMGGLDSGSDEAVQREEEILPTSGLSGLTAGGVDGYASGGGASSICPAPAAAHAAHTGMWSSGGCCNGACCRALCVPTHARCRWGSPDFSAR
eukprot:COSAG01_NODE_5169_length_4435_cov_4.063624_6_plen_312_part_00